MNASDPTAAIGSGADTSAPYDILYLDRPRLRSYASQLYEGVPTQRAIHDFLTYRSIVTGERLEHEESTSNTASGSAGLTVPFQMKGSSASTRGARELRRRQAHDSEREEGAEQHTLLDVEDNLLIAVLEDLRSRNWLRPIENGITAPGLYEATGPIQFFDWALIHHFLTRWNDLIAAVQELDKGKEAATKQKFGDLSKNTAKTLANFAQALGVQGFHVHMSPDGQPLTAALATEHLTITPEQMTVTYLRDEPITGTLIAYINPSIEGDLVKTGLARHVKFGTLLKAFIGDSLKVLPLALYFPVAGPVHAARGDSDEGKTPS